MKIQELTEKRSGITSQITALLAVDMTDESRTQVSTLEKEYEKLGADIETAKRQAERSKSITANVIETRNEVKSLGVSFREFLRDAVEGKGKLEFRVEPMLTTSNTDVINKTVANSVDIILAPGEAFLHTLGCTFYPGLVGNFVVPSMAEDLATFPGEGVAGADASMNIEDLVLAGRRVTHSQSITKETLTQTNPAIYNSIVQNLVNGLWNATVKDVFTNILSDAASQVVVTGAPLTFTDLVNAEASLGGLSIGPASYVTTPSIKGYLKKTIALGTTVGPAIWVGNELNGYPSYSAPQLAANKVIFGDFSRVAVGTWGGLEIIVDPYTKAKEGKLVLTALMIVDDGVTNKRAFAIRDGSIA